MRIGIGLDDTLTQTKLVEMLKKLKENGNEIYIITARDEISHDDPYMQSKVWLDSNGIVYDKIIVNARNKGKVCIDEKIDLFIDDQLNNCISTINSGIPTIRMSDEKNNDIVTFSNWKDIYEYITNNKIVKIIKYDPFYNTQASEFITESIHFFIGRTYKLREDIINIEDYYIKNGGNFWCAIDVKTDEIIGTIALEKRGDIGILKRFYVNSNYQNLRIGIRLYEMLERFVINDTNIKMLYLACRRALEKAHKFYIKNDWKQIDKLPIEMHIEIDYDLFEKVIER